MMWGWDGVLFWGGFWCCLCWFVRRFGFSEATFNREPENIFCRLVTPSHSARWITLNCSMCCTVRAFVHAYHLHIFYVNTTGYTFDYAQWCAEPLASEDEKTMQFDRCMEYGTYRLGVYYAQDQVSNGPCLNNNMFLWIATLLSL